MTFLSVAAPLNYSALLPTPSSPLSSKPLLLRSLSLRFKSPPPPYHRVRALLSSSESSPHSKPLSHGGAFRSGLESEPFFSSPSSPSCGPFSPVSSAPRTPATASMGAGSDVMGLMLRERIVFLGGSISEFVADAIISQLILLDSQDHTKDIRLFINSHGGPVSASMAIYDVVQLLRADVSTIVIGHATCTAAIILGGGAKGKRLAMPNARIMIRQPLGGLSGQALEVEIQAEELNDNKDNITRIISGFSGRTFEQVQKDIDRENFMSAFEAVEYGIIDGVIDRDTIIPLVPVPEKVNPN